jgi:hypothetical protein
LDNVSKYPKNNYILVCTDIETIEAITKYIHSKSDDCTVITVLVIGNSHPEDLEELKRNHESNLCQDEDTWTWDEVVRVITDALLKTSSFDYVIINPHLDNKNIGTIEDRIVFQWDRFFFSDGKRVLPKHKSKKGNVMFIRPLEPSKKNSDEKYQIRRLRNDKREVYALPEFVSVWMNDYFERNGFEFKVVSLDHNDNLLIVEQIKEDIEKADIILCDLTYNRANCYWELGYAEGLGKPVILIVEDGSKNEIPFDKQGFTRFAFSLKENDDGDYNMEFEKITSSSVFSEVNSHRQQLKEIKEGKGDYNKRNEWEFKYK